MKTIVYKGKEYTIYKRARNRLVLISETGFIIVSMETILNENIKRNQGVRGFKPQRSKVPQRR